MDFLQNIINQKESVWLDFKREFHENNAKLLHDILCLSNALHDGDRYIIFGVANDKSIFGTENDSNRKTNADIHDFLRQANLNRIPSVEITFHSLNNHEISLLKIANEPYKPFTLRKDFTRDKFSIRSGVVYTRLGDTNIPHNEAAPEDHIEKMWKERLNYQNIKFLSFEDRFPVKLDDSQEDVIGKLGKPDAEGWKIAQYYTEGFEISYDQHFDTVEGISIYNLPSGTAFEGTLLGVKLGDSFSKVKEVLGQPTYWGLVYEKGTIAIWEIGEVMVFIEIWSNKYRDSSVPSQQLGTVRAVSYCKRKSLIAYNAMVAKAMKELRQGILPESFEREERTFLDINIEDPIFQKDYELLGGRQAEMGGVEVLVGFPETEEVLGFWIYPLQWQFPVIRGVYKLNSKILRQE